MKYRRNRHKSDKINNRTRTVNGVHVFQIDDFVSEEKYKKLPKDWTYDTQLFEITTDKKVLDEFELFSYDIKNPNDIKEAYNKGLLVEKNKIFHGMIESEITKQGYRIIKKYYCWMNNANSISIEPYKVYRTYEETQAEVDRHVFEFNKHICICL